MRDVIVNADDFGLCTGVIDGILYGLRRGIITSASLMTTVRKSGEAVLAATAQPRLDAGLHLCFTEGYPVIPPSYVPSLVNETGRFLTPEEWLSTGRRPDIEELAVELRGQLNLAKQAKLPISHVDVHHSFAYTMPDVFRLLVELAAENGVAMRYPFGEGWQTMLGQGVAAKISAAQAERAVTLYRGLVAEFGVPHPDRLVDAFPTLEQCTPEAFSAVLHGLGDGVSEILSHPGLEMGCRRYLGQRAAKRAAELRVLCHPAVRETLDREGIRLISFRDLRRG